jgi:CubicO group peptidase (beta-lactamase class C family)
MRCGTPRCAARHASVCCLLLVILPGAARGQAGNEEVLERIRAEAESTRTDALRIWRDGELILSYDAPDAPERFFAQSVTKPIIALAVLKLVEDGFLESLDQAVYSLYPEWRQGRKRHITVRHILMHTSGLQNEAYVQAELAHLPDRVQAALAADVVEEPGTVFRYNNKAFGLLSGIIERASGERAEDYIRRALFVPLEIREARLHYDPSGRNLAVIGGLELPTDELTRIGQLLLDGGRYQGRQVIREDLVQEAIAPALPVGRAGAIGLAWFLDRRIVRVEFGDSAMKVLGTAPLDARFLARAEQLRGVYPDYLAFRDRVAEVFGGSTTFDAQLQAHSIPLVGALGIEREQNPSYIFHSGDGGQYLYVVPGSRLVAVRMIRDHFSPILESPEFKGKDTSDPAIGQALGERFQALSEATGFWNFGGLVLRLR